MRLEQPLKERKSLCPYLSVFADKKRSLSFQEAQNQLFTPIESFQPDSQFEAGRYYYWYHFKVENTTSDTIPLSLNMPAFDSILIYSVENNGLDVQPLTIGKFIRQHPQKEKTSYPSNRTALLYFPPHTTQQFYMRCHSMSYPSNFQARLFQPQYEAAYFGRALIFYYAWNACFLGILIFAFFTSLFNYGQTHHKAFLYYAGYILTHFVYYWVYLEAFDQFLNILPDWLFDYYYYTPISWAWGFFYLLFLASFFESKQKQPQMHRLIQIATFGFVVLFLIDRILISYDYWLALQATVWERYLLNLVGLFLVGYMLIKMKRNRLAVYILLGSISYTLGALGTRIIKNTNEFWDDSLLYHQLGILFELLFFSMGLAYKFRLDVVEKDRYMIENQRLELERALGLANLRNQIAQDIHDEIGAGLTKIALGAQFMLRLPNITMSDVKEKVKHLESDSRQLAAHLREIVFAINPEYDDFDEMQAYFRDTAQYFWAETDMKLNFDFPKNSKQFAVTPDKKRHLLLIFTEILNNIAKHAKATQVDLSFKMASQSDYLLTIHDNGIGFDPLSINGLSKGLSGMKSRAESIGATFFIESNDMIGTILRIHGSF